MRKSRDAVFAQLVVHILPVIGCVLIGALFLVSGAGKVASPSATIRDIASVGVPLPVAAYIGALGLETVGGVALVLGYQTRLVSLLFAGYCLITAVLFHGNVRDHGQLINFLKNLALAGGLLQFTIYGRPRHSIDAWISDK